MSKPFMFSFHSKIIYIFLFTKLFPKLFLEKSKKISPRKQKLSSLCYKTYFYDTRAKKTPKAGRLSELIFSRAQSLRND